MLGRSVGEVVSVGTADGMLDFDGEDDGFIDGKVLDLTEGVSVGWFDMVGVELGFKEGTVDDDGMEVG